MSALSSKYTDFQAMFLLSSLVVSRSVRGSIAWMSVIHLSSWPELNSVLVASVTLSIPNSVTTSPTVFWNSRYRVTTSPFQFCARQYSPVVSGYRPGKKPATAYEQVALAFMIGLHTSLRASEILRVAAQYAKLSAADIQTLVVQDKWLAVLQVRVQGELDRVSQSLTARIKQLAERYDTPIPQLVAEVETLAARVDEHLKKMGFVWN